MQILLFCEKGKFDIYLYVSASCSMTQFIVYIKFLAVLGTCIFRLFPSSHLYLWVGFPVATFWEIFIFLISSTETM